MRGKRRKGKGCGDGKDKYGRERGREWERVRGVVREGGSKGRKRNKRWERVE